MLIHPALQCCVHVNRSDTMYVLYYTCVWPKWLWQGTLAWNNYVIVYSHNTSKKTDRHTVTSCGTFYPMMQWIAKVPEMDVQHSETALYENIPCLLQK